METRALTSSAIKQPVLKISRCCEPGCNNIADSCACRSCKNSLCDSCYNNTIDRSKRMNFYISYTSYCDTCIWFDMG